jgi:hypothetical protein
VRNYVPSSLRAITFIHQSIDLSKRFEELT